MPPLFSVAFKMPVHAIGALLSAARQTPHLGEVQSFVFEKFFQTWKKTDVREPADKQVRK
jgi:hypothetical protein